MHRILTLLALLPLLAGLPLADHYVKQKSHTDPVTIMGQSQPARDEVAEHWYGDNRVAVHAPQSSFIVDGGRNVMYMLNHQEKTYVEMALPLDVSRYMPPQMAPMMEQMMNSIQVKVTPRGDTRTVNGFACEGYDVEMSMMMMKMKMNVWASPAVPFDWQKVAQLMQNIQMISMRMKPETIAEFAKVKGHWISTEMNAEVMGSTVRTVQEVLEIANRTPPPGTFDVPAGYKKQDTLSMQSMQ